MSDRHNVTARISGVRFAVSSWPSYNAALEAYYPLDLALREGRLAMATAPAKPCPYAGIAHTDAVLVAGPGHGGNDYLAVRDAADPLWSGLPEAPLLVLAANRGGRAKPFDVVPSIPYLVGSTRHTHAGGWIYEGDDKAHRLCVRTSTQGWETWWTAAGPRLRSHLAHIGGRWIAAA
jgi:hypothetical protein